MEQLIEQFREYEKSKSSIEEILNKHLKSFVVDVQKYLLPIFEIITQRKYRSLLDAVMNNCWVDIEEIYDIEEEIVLIWKGNLDYPTSNQHTARTEYFIDPIARKEWLLRIVSEIEETEQARKEKALERKKKQLEDLKKELGE